MMTGFLGNAAVDERPLSGFFCACRSSARDAEPAAVVARKSRRVNFMIFSRAKQERPSRIARRGCEAALRQKRHSAELCLFVGYVLSLAGGLDRSVLVGAEAQQ